MGRGIDNLEGKEEVIFELITDGVMFSDIAARFSVSVGTLYKFLYREAHALQVRTALALSAASYVDKATQVLLDAKPEEMFKARELAHHYRWLAAKRSPKQFGDKVNLSTDDESSGVVILLPAKDRIDQQQTQLQAIADKLNNMHIALPRGE